MSPNARPVTVRVAAVYRRLAATSLGQVSLFLCVLLVSGAVSHVAAQNQETALESFASDPLARGWRIGGNPTLFSWNSAQQGLDITWDSSKSNSFFYLPLNTILTKADDFQLTFVLRMKDITLGTTPGKPAEFPLALGWINRQSITNQNGYRGAGVSPLYGIKNIAEWNFFPDAGFGDTWATTIISTNNVFAYAHTFPLPLLTDGSYRITLHYDAANQTMQTTALLNGQSVGTLEIVLLANTPDFRLDAISISSYSDAIQIGPAIYHGSVLAHGTMEEITWTVPAPPLSNLTIRASAAGTFVEFSSKTNWLYILERSINLREWRPASLGVTSTGARVTLQDTNEPAPNAFFRIRAERP